MRAVGFYEYGNADVLQVLDLPAVNAGEGEVRVRVHAAAINPTDILSRSGARKDQWGKRIRMPINSPLMARHMFLVWMSLVLLTRSATM